MYRFNQNLQKQLYKSGANVVLMKEASREAVDEFAPEVVIIAAGAEPVMPNIPGMDGVQTVAATDVLTDRVETGRNVVVLGGGEVGCEAAAHLDNQGKKVTVIELQNDILTAPMSHNGKCSLLMLLDGTSVKFEKATRLTEILPGKVKISNASGDAELDCDTLVMAVGFRSDKTLKESLQGGDYRVFSIGDYNQPRKVWYAVHEGFHILRQLDDLMNA